MSTFTHLLNLYGACLLDVLDTRKRDRHGARPSSLMEEGK